MSCFSNENNCLTSESQWLEFACTYIHTISSILTNSHKYAFGVVKNVLFIGQFYRKLNSFKKSITYMICNRFCVKIRKKPIRLKANLHLYPEPIYTSSTASVFI